MQQLWTWIRSLSWVHFFRFFPLPLYPSTAHGWKLHGCDLKNLFETEFHELGNCFSLNQRNNCTEYFFHLPTPLPVSPWVPNEDWNFKLHINLLAEFVTSPDPTREWNMQWRLYQGSGIELKQIEDRERRNLSWIYEFLSDKNISILLKHIIKTEIRLNGYFIEILDYFNWKFVFNWKSAVFNCIRFFLGVRMALWGWHWT